MQNLIKSPSILRYGYRYEMKKPSNVRYRYVEPMEHADGMRRGECWVVDVAGDVNSTNVDAPILFSAKVLKNGELRKNKGVSLILGEKVEKKKLTKKDRRRKRIMNSRNLNE